MLRTALRPRWLGLFALVVVVVAVFVQLGLWQVNVAQDRDRAEALQEQAAQPLQPLSRVVQPHEPFPADGSGVPVTTTGRYDAAGQLLVPDRLLDGEPGYWVLTPLVVRDTGARLPVMRGFVTDPGQASAPTTTGPVTVQGTLAPGEAPVTTTDLPPGQIDSIDLAVLVNTWPGQLYNAFVFATDEQPDATAAGITAVPPPSLVQSGLDWRNAGYALQWWVFAAFTVYMWWRMVREDHLRSRPPTDDPQPDHRRPERSPTLHA